jgi:hypothetical protein
MSFGLYAAATRFVTCHDGFDHRRATPHGSACRPIAWRRVCLVRHDSGGRREMRVSPVAVAVASTLLVLMGCSTPSGTPFWQQFGFKSKASQPATTALTPAGGTNANRPASTVVPTVSSPGVAQTAGNLPYYPGTNYPVTPYPPTAQPAAVPGGPASAGPASGWNGQSTGVVGGTSPQYAQPQYPPSSIYSAANPGDSTMR